MLVKELINQYPVISFKAGNEFIPLSKKKNKDKDLIQLQFKEEIMGNNYNIITLLDKNQEIDFTNSFTQTGTVLVKDVITNCNVELRFLK